MTNLQAIKSLIEYRGTESDYIFDKVLLDRAITGGDDYTASNAKSIDLALADACLYLSTHPEESEGKWRIKWTRFALLGLRTTLFNKHGVVAPEISNANKNMPLITGKPDAIGTDDYPAW